MSLTYVYHLSINNETDLMNYVKLNLSRLLNDYLPTEITPVELDITINHKKSYLQIHGASSIWSKDKLGIFKYCFSSAQLTMHTELNYKSSPLNVFLFASTLSISLHIEWTYMNMGTNASVFNTLENKREYLNYNILENKIEVFN